MTPNIDIASNINLLLPQYDCSPRLQALISGCITILQEEIVDPLLVLDHAISTDISEGVLLDFLGTRLGLARPSVRSADAEYFGFDGTAADAGRTWGQAPFFSIRAGIEEVEPVGDMNYRLLLKARARRLRGSASREVIEENLDILFGNGHLDESGTDPVLQVSTSNLELFGLVSGSEFERVIPRPAGQTMSMVNTSP